MAYDNYLSPAENARIDKMIGMDMRRDHDAFTFWRWFFG